MNYSCIRCKINKEEKEFFKNGKLFKSCNSCRNTREKWKITTKRKVPVNKKCAEEKYLASLNGNLYCCSCRKEKSKEQFSPDKHQSNGLSGYCTECLIIKNRVNVLKRKYNLTLEEFKELLEKQNGKCKICDKNLSYINLTKNQKDSACVDHSHKTNEVRGILCSACNLAIGLLQDKKEIIMKAYKYLENYGDVNK